MRARGLVPVIVALGAAWVLVQPDTPRPGETTAAVVSQASSGVAQGTAAEAGSDTAIGLLGETWTVEAPAPLAPLAPVVRPLTAAEHAAAMAAARSSGTATVARAGSTDLATAAPLRRPVPRPQAILRADAAPTVPVAQSAQSASAGSIVVVSPGGTALDAPPPVIVLRGDDLPEVEVADSGMRWVVRQQGSGDVLAEVSLSEALHMLTSR